MHRIHLGVSEANRLNEAKALLDFVLDPRVKTVTGGSTSGSIHAWSVDASTQDFRGTAPGGEPVCIHSRESTLQTLLAV